MRHHRPSPQKELEIPSVFPAQDSTLSARALAETIRQRYDLSGHIECTFFRKGICDTYRIEDEGQRLYLKVYRHARRTRLDVSEEVRLLNFLSACGISVARPIQRLDGQSVNELAAPEGNRYAVLFEAANGVAGDDGKSAKIRALGEMVAHLHQATDELDEPYQRQPLDMHHLVDENLSVIEPLLAHRPADFELIRSIGDECKARVSALLPESKPVYGICHGDLHGGDVCYDSDNSPTLFDFDSSGTGWRALDIGVFLASDEWMAISDEAEKQRQQKFAAFLAGYEEVRTLSDQELAAVQLMPPIRHIFLMGHVLRYTAIWEGRHWADDQFIDWHMTWYEHWADSNL